MLKFSEAVHLSLARCVKCLFDIAMATAFWHASQAKFRLFWQNSSFSLVFLSSGKELVLFFCTTVGVSLRLAVPYLSWVRLQIQAWWGYEFAVYVHPKVHHIRIPFVCSDFHAPLNSFLYEQVRCEQTRNVCVQIRINSRAGSGKCIYVCSRHSLHNASAAS